MIIDKQVTAAVAAAGVNIIAGHEQEKVGYHRYLVAVGLVGSTAIGDTIVSIRVGGKEVDVVENQATGLAMLSTSMLASRTFVPANTLVEVVVTDAAAANPVRIRLVFIP